MILLLVVIKINFITYRRMILLLPVLESGHAKKKSPTPMIRLGYFISLPLMNF